MTKNKILTKFRFANFDLVKGEPSRNYGCKREPARAKVIIGKIG